MAREMISIPKWIIEPDVGPYHLLAVYPNGEVSTDGGHGSPAGVTKAKALYESIGIIRPPEGTRYVMVKFSEVPEGKPRINKGAVEALNSISPIPAGTTEESNRG